MTGLVGLSDVDAEDTLTAPTISLPFTSDSSDAHGVIAVVLALATRLPAPVEGFFHREKIRALPKSRAARWDESGVGAGDSRRRLEPVTRYSGAKIRAGLVRSTGRA